MIYEAVTMSHVIRVLNELLVTDSRAVSELLKYEKLADHEPGSRNIDLLSIINNCFSSDSGPGPITYELDQLGNITKFFRRW